MYLYSLLHQSFQYDLMDLLNILYLFFNQIYLLFPFTILISSFLLILSKPFFHFKMQLPLIVSQYFRVGQTLNSYFELLVRWLPLLNYQW